MSTINLINFATKISIKSNQFDQIYLSKNGQKDITTINLINFAQYKSQVKNSSNLTKFPLSKKNGQKSYQQQI